MGTLQAQIDPHRLPQHVAIIMDGNGRWAKNKGYLRAIGHENGVDALRKVATASARLGIRYLTVYAFSSENWNRPKSEVNTLMGLLVSSLSKELKTLLENDIKLRTIGKVENLPARAQRELQEVIERTRDCKRMDLTLALSYGSKEEITDGVRYLAAQVEKGKLKAADITQAHLTEALYTAQMPDPDLLIRTSNERRISNYLLWQIAYAELYFTPKLWPDFGEEDLHQAVLDYQNRERRYGKISEQLKSQ